MVVTAWNNGSHHPSGSGYGLKISSSDRDRYFKREWDHVIFELEGRHSTVKVNVSKKSFWGKSCRELISAEIGKWLWQEGFAFWKKGEPPKLKLEPVGDNRFFLRKKLD